MSKIVFVMTGADAWTLADGARRPTGFWADEAVIPYEAFKAAGHEITVATPGGVVPPADPTSLSAGANGGEAGAAAVRAVLDSAEFRHPSVLSDVRVEDFDAVYVPGGRGPMEDLAVDADCGRVLTEAVESGLPVGVVCHGPAALLAAVKEDGTNAYSGYRITTFSNAEEQLTGCAEISEVAAGGPAHRGRSEGRGGGAVGAVRQGRPQRRDRPEPRLLRSARHRTPQEARLTP